MSDETKSLERYADLLDTKFRVPGTNIRFGLDFIIGLFPVVGDIFSLALSGGLLLMMVKKGASGKALILMILNIVLDAIIGSIPILGDLFDLFFKANKRNLDLYQNHFEEGEHQGSAWPVILTVMATLVVVFILVIWGILKLFGAVYSFLA